jgi:hypothetical protein
VKPGHFGTHSMTTMCALSRTNSIAASQDRLLLNSCIATPFVPISTIKT